MRGLPDRESRLGVGDQRGVAVPRVLWSAQKPGRARVFRQVDHHGQLDETTTRDDARRREREIQFVSEKESRHRDVRAGAGKVHLEVGGEVPGKAEKQSGRHENTRRRRRRRQKEDEKEEEEEEDDARKATEEEIKDVTTVESMRNMSEEELRVLELSVKMRDVLSKEKSNALCEARLSVERKQLAAKLAGLDLKKESNETTKQTNDMKRESLEFKMKLNRDKVFREDVADALRTGLVVVCGALVYYGWNVIRDAWLNESEICYSASYAAASFSLVPSNLGVLFSAFTNRLEKLWCVSKTFAKALFTSIASLYCSKLVVKFGLLSSTNSTVSPLSSIALTVGVGGGYLGYKFVRYLRGDETKFLYLWSFYVLSVFAANESADYIGREVLQSTLRRILFRVTLGLAFPLIIASGSFR